MIKSLLRNFRTKTATVYRKIFGYPVGYDALNGGGKHKKRSLLIYLVKPFLSDKQNPAFFRKHQNWLQNLEIAKILDSMGYVVDVVHYQDLRFKPRYSYDLMIGMGMGCSRIAKMLPHAITKIYITTGSETGFNNEQELARINEVEARRGRHFKPRRLAKFNSNDLRYFTAITCFGNDFIASTFRPFHDRIYCLNNYGYTDIKYYEKNFEQTRHNFLYFASSGQVHRGLNLLLEVFSLRPDYNLYICGPFQNEIDFVRCYKKELFETPNIHPVGWVQVPEKDFAEVCTKCTYVILPSCAEGQVGSVVVCMYAGLIPIVSKECGIDTGDFGITLDSCEIETISATVTKLANMPSEWVQQKSIKTRTAAIRDFSEKAFSQRWSEIIIEVTQQGKSAVTRVNNY